MAAPAAGFLPQFQIPTPSFIENLEATFVDDFIKVATVIAIIGIATSIFTMAPVLGLFSGLMLGVCLIAKSALESAAGRQTAEVALRNSESVTTQMQNELTELKNTLRGIQENEPRNATLIQSLNSRIEEQSTAVERLTVSENELKQKLHQANKLEKQIETTCTEFRKVITDLKSENETLRAENATLKSTVTLPPKQEMKRSFFSSRK